LKLYATSARKITKFWSRFAPPSHNPHDRYHPLESRLQPAAKIGQQSDEELGGLPIAERLLSLRRWLGASDVNLAERDGYTGSFQGAR
jgi:hypothetical protein